MPLDIKKYNKFKMLKTGKIYSINISEENGVKKIPVNQAEINQQGIAGDGHSGDWHRQVSLLSNESIENFNKSSNGKVNAQPGDFGENITTSGISLSGLKPGDRLVFYPQPKQLRDNETILEVTQIGKKCLEPCRIFYTVGSCIMPIQGIFCRVIKPGLIKKAYNIKISITKKTDDKRGNIIL